MRSTDGSWVSRQERRSNTLPSNRCRLGSPYLKRRFAGLSLRGRRIQPYVRVCRDCWMPFRNPKPLCRLRLAGWALWLKPPRGVQRLSILHSSITRRKNSFRSVTTPKDSSFTKVIMIYWLPKRGLQCSSLSPRETFHRRVGSASVGRARLIRRRECWYRGPEPCSNICCRRFGREAIRTRFSRKVPRLPCTRNRTSRAQGAYRGESRNRVARNGTPTFIIVITRLDCRASRCVNRIA